MSNDQPFSSVERPVVITAYANDQDAYLDMLHEEEKEIMHCLQPCSFLEHVNIPNATIDQIFDVFNNNINRVGLFHYAGHAGGTHLHLEDTKANAKGLAGMIKEHGCLPIVFLNGCSTENQVSLLLEAGVGVVVATKVDVDDEAALAFARWFYKRLAENHSIERAFNDAKNYLVARELRSDDDFTVQRRKRGGRGIDVKPATSAWALYVGDENVLQLSLPELASFINRQRLALPYALWLEKQHSKIPMAGLKGSSEIALDKVFVSLRGELSKSYEIFQTQKFFEEELEALEKSWEEQPVSELEKQQQRSRLLGRTAIMPSIDERDMKLRGGEAAGANLNLAEAFIRYDKLVVLGDPGTGKTTLARWLALMFAQAIIQGDKTLKVPAHLVNAAGAAPGSHFDFGGNRFPILIRVGELAQAQKENPKLKLDDFIGCQSWMGRYPYYHEESLLANQPISPDALRELSLDFLRKGEAVLLLDGLDEISEELERKDMVAAIQDFICRVVDLPKAKGLKKSNKLVITSRIAGYHTCPVQHEELFHVTIQAMEERAIQHFCGTWMKAAHQKANPGKKLLQLEFEAVELARGLLHLIFSPNRHGVRDLASNPLLLTELCKIYYSEDRKLPDTRVALYKKAADNFFQVWESRIRNRAEEVETLRKKTAYVLEDIAEYIHEKYPTGLIIGKEVEILARQGIECFYKDNPQVAPSTNIDIEVRLFLKSLREEVGILAERAEELYGFLHLTFEEYFAARKLIRYREKITEAIISKAYQPRWREPLLMAIGSMNQSLLKEERDEVLRALLDIQDPMGNLVPRSANLAALSFAEMSYQPDGDLVRDVVFKLIQAYAATESFEDGGILRSNVEETFLVLKKRQEIHAKVLEIFDFIIKSSQFERRLKNAVAHLVYQLKWHTQTIVNAVIEHRSHDAMAWDWPFHRILQDVANQNPDLLNHPSLEFRAYLQEYPEVASFINNNQAWAKVIFLLYGGLVEKKENNKSFFSFSPGGIFQESFLTDDIIEALEEEESPGALKQLCHEEWQRNQNGLEKRVDCLLCLAAMGEPIVPELKKLAAQPDEQLNQAAIQRLSRLNMLLKRPVGVMGRETSGSIGRIVKEMNMDSIQRFVTNVVQITTSFEEKISSPITWIQAMPAELQPRTLAELWVHAFTSDDPAYNIAVVLDTLGEEINKLGPETIAASFSEVSQAISLPPHDKWAVERVPYQPRSKKDVLEEAIRNIDAMSHEFDMLKFWALRELKPLIEQYPELKGTIKIVLLRMKSRLFAEETIKLFFPKEEGEPDTEKGNAPPQMAAVSYIDWESPLEPEEDSHSQYPHILISARDNQKSFDLRGLSRNFMNRPDKLLRLLFEVLAYYRKTELLSYTESGSLKEQSLASLLGLAEELIAHLETPELQVRGFLKLVSFCPASERERVIAIALHQAEKIAPGDGLAISLRAIKPWILNSRNLRKMFLQQKARLTNPIHRSLIENRYYPYFLGLPDIKEKNAELALLSLGALIRDGNQLFTLPENAEELWELVQVPGFPRLEELVGKLCRIGQKDGIQLTLQGALAISYLIHQEHAKLVYQLFPVVKAPVPEAITVVANWLNSDDEKIRCFSSLLLLESGVINGKSFPLLEKILFEDFDKKQDQFRNRANLALNRTAFSTSLIGLDCIKQIQKAISKHRDSAPYLIKALSWLYESLIFDDAEIIEQLIREAEGKGRKSKLALSTLARIQKISGKPTHQAYLKGFYHQDKRIVKQFLYSSIFVLHQQKGVFSLHENHTEDIRKALAHNLSSDDPEVQNFALDAYGYLPELLQSDIRLLREKIVSGSESQQKLGLIALGRSNFASEEEYISGFLNTGNTVLQLAAAEAICRHLIQKYGSEPETALSHIEAALNNKGLLLPALLEATKDRWWRAYSKNCVRILGSFFDQRPEAYHDFAGEVLPFLTAEKEQGEKETYAYSVHWMTRMVYLDALSSGAEKLPSTYMRQVKNLPDFEGVLQRVVRRSPIFTDRMNAIKCLSLLRKMSPISVEAFCTALKDISNVQEVAVDSTQRFQEIDQHFIEAIAVSMDDVSLSARYAMVNILAAIGNYNKTDSSTRQEILKVLLSKLGHPDYKHHVYILKKSRDGAEANILEHIGRLDHEIYRKILEVSGIKEKVTF
ncbi:MAG: CHAT domain-containing protein [Phaeodactylibacter sp.]|nr:CHAT domain-containing protein [Phaeodactylibacter sp.]